MDLELLGNTGSGTVLVTRGPYLQMGTPNAVSLRWRTDASTDSRVRYGTSAANLNQSKTSATVTQEHEVRLTGLQSDESNDRLVVRTLDGSDLAVGKTVEVEATVYAYSNGTSDHLDLYYTADANNPAWTLINTIDLTSGGTQALTASYTLPTGSRQAVRANFRYNGSPSACGSGNYDDTDDLVFAVAGGGGGGGGGGPGQFRHHRHARRHP